jgi:alkylhydroperoxidase family enzyme
MRVSVPTSPDQIMPNIGAHFAPEIVGASSGFARATYQHSKLSLRMFEAARIATAVINGCIVCKNWRAARDVSHMGLTSGIIDRGPAPDEALYQAVLADDLSGLDAREQLAVQYVQRMGRDPQGLAQDEAFWAAFKAALSEDEIVDLTYCAACWIGLGRAAHILGMDTACTLPTLQMADAA